MSQVRHRILFLMDGWESAAGGIQTFNRELACAVARGRSEIECVVITPTSTDQERNDAFSRGVTLISGPTGGDWKAILLSRKISELPQDKVLAIVGHSYFSGEEALLLRERFYPNALGIHFVHMSPLHTESLKEYRTGSYVTEREAKVRKEIALASKANLIFCVGPRLYRYMHDLLGAQGVNTQRISKIECGLSRPPERTRLKPIQPKLLCLGRTDSVGVKGIDIFAYAAGLLTDDWMKHPSTSGRPLPEFVARGAKEKPEDFERDLVSLTEKAGRKANIRANSYTTDRKELDAEYRSSSIFLMPSREEGFGLVACEALSLGVPVLVSSESGFAEVVRRVAMDAHMSTEQCIISMDGDISTVARRYADAALKILVDEDRSSSYFQALQERLLPICSWDAGARHFLTTLDRTAQVCIGHKVADSKVHSSGAAHLVEESEANGDLSKHRERLLAIPGVLATGIKRALVVFVEKGKIVEIPNEIGGIDVVVREVESIRLSAGDALGAGNALLIDGERVAVVGAIVGDRSSTYFGLTVAHAIPKDGEHVIEIETAAGTLPVTLHFIDRDLDLALLSLPDSGVLGSAVSAAERAGPFLESAIGTPIRLKSPGGVVEGIISAVEISARLPSLGEASARLQQGMFEVRLSSTIALGTSGSPVLDEHGQLLGIVVAMFRDAEDSMHAVLVRPIYEILRGMDLSLITFENDVTITNVGVLVTSDYTLSRLLSKLNDPVRISRRGDAYFQGKIGPRGPNVVATTLSRIGNIGSAIVTTKLLGGFDVHYVMLLGICGGLRPGDQQLGDVVVSSDILYYEPGAIDKGRDLRRTRIAGTTPRWLSSLAASITITDGNLVGPNTIAPRIHVGPIASGEKVIRDASALTSLMGEWQSALAVEMEAAGMAEAVSSAAGGQIPFVVIRGIADFADASKDDRFRELAAERAVDVGVQLLEKLPLQQFDISTPQRQLYPHAGVRTK